MKKVISIILMLSVIFILITGCTADNNTIKNDEKKTIEQGEEKSDTIVMFTNAEFAPFEYFKGEDIVGVDIDIAKEIAKDLDKTLEVEHIDFSSIVPAISSGKADFGAAGMTITPERMEAVDFSIPYVESIQHVIYIKGEEIKSMDDLKGKKIGVQLGTTADISLTDAINLDDGLLKDSDAEVKTYKNALEASQDLLIGRLDVVVIDKLTAEEIVKNNEKLETEILGDISEAYGICVKKGNTELLNSINRTLERLIKEEKIKEFIQNHSN